MTIVHLDRDPRSEEEKKRDEEIIKHIGCCDPVKRLARVTALRIQRSYQRNEAAKVGLSLAAYRKMIAEGKA